MSDVEQLYWAWIRAQYAYEQAIGVAGTREIMDLHRKAGVAFESMREYGLTQIWREALEGVRDTETTTEA